MNKDAFLGLSASGFLFLVSMLMILTILAAVIVDKVLADLFVFVLVMLCVWIVARSLGADPQAQPKSMEAGTK